MVITPLWIFSPLYVWHVCSNYVISILVWKWSSSRCLILRVCWVYWSSSFFLLWWSRVRPCIMSNELWTHPIINWSQLWRVYGWPSVQSVHWASATQCPNHWWEWYWARLLPWQECWLLIYQCQSSWRPLQISIRIYKLDSSYRNKDDESHRRRSQEKSNHKYPLMDTLISIAFNFGKGIFLLSLIYTKVDRWSLIYCIFLRWCHTY